ncbi:hypothetical protein SCHPADRAFT_162772 [Schizopora paradoxa]|uniref:Uncharacterized protein n=1 Tax=Schizopora paradoxa TaxID=27342 RepID=A0A0H2S757_9AGAM|nr:hypothetical protein SCHPADRAFT_162772 [Schizopora paradoxa]
MPSYSASARATEPQRSQPSSPSYLTSPSIYPSRIPPTSSRQSSLILLTDQFHPRSTSFKLRVPFRRSSRPPLVLPVFLHSPTITELLEGGLSALIVIRDASARARVLGSVSANK